VLIAITGILIPIGLSFTLIPLFLPGEVGPLSAFAAGAALSSTSLGTTFTILSTAKLATTKIGTVLTGAALLDDVVGLVMVKIISSIQSGVTAEAVLRPIGVSIAFLFVMLVLCKLLKKAQNKWRITRWVERIEHIGFVATSLSLFGSTVLAGYAGTSILFTAYLIGVSGVYVFGKSALNSYAR